MDLAAGGPRDRRGGVEVEGGDDAGDVDATGGGGGAARWIRRPAAHATGLEAEGGDVAGDVEAEGGGGGAARRDRSSGRRPARPARQREGGHGAGDVEGGGRRWWRGAMDPAAGSPARPARWSGGGGQRRYRRCGGGGATRWRQRW